MPPMANAATQDPNQINAPSSLPRSLNITITEAIQGTNKVIVINATIICAGSNTIFANPAAPKSRRISPIINTFAVSFGNFNIPVVNGAKHLGL